MFTNFAKKMARTKRRGQLHNKESSTVGSKYPTSPKESGPPSTVAVIVISPGRDHRPCSGRRSVTMVSRPFPSGIGPNNILGWNLRGYLVRAMAIEFCAQWQRAEVDCSPIPPEIAKWTLRRSLTGHRSMSIRPDQHCESATIVELQQKNALIGLVHSSRAFLIGEMVFGQMHRSFHWEGD